MRKGRLVMLVAGSLLTASPLFAQRWGREDAPRDGACFYEDAGFRGDYFCVRAGDRVRSMPPGMNDRISSIRIFGRASVTVYQDVYYEGRSRRFWEDVRNLRDFDWNDKISSVEVRGVPRRDDDDRRRLSDDDRRRFSDDDRRHFSDDDRAPRRGLARWEAEEIVRRAYLAVLDREPDPGSRGYVEKVLREGWTRKDVERELRQSREYRDMRH